MPFGNDVDKNFTWACYEILGEQTEEDAKIGNRARSWGPFKETLRQWFIKYARQTKQRRLTRLST